MKVLATADLHGSLPKVEPCDILLIAGDVSPMHSHDLEDQREWLQTQFSNWLRNVPADHIVGIAGNHDFVLESDPALARQLPWTYLLDEHVDIEGLRIFGTPWVPNLPNWAFYGGQDGCAVFKNGRFPKNIDVLLAHGPMRGFGDTVGPRFGGPVEVGCIYMRERIRSIKPQAFVCGHIHEGYGHYRHPYVELGVYNVAHNTEHYRPVNALVEIPLRG